MDEVWKPVVNFLNADGSVRYEVSNKGQVRMPARIIGGRHYKAKILRQQIGTEGYKTISLSDYLGRHHTCMVQRLVALAFVPMPEGECTVTHKDGDRLNNCADNLVWRKFSYVGVGLDSGRKHAVRQYTKDGSFVSEYASAKEAAKAIYLSSGHAITSCCKRKAGYFSAGGFLWRFPEDDELAK